MSKFRDLLRNKTAVIIAAAMLLLIAAVITASLTGVFSGKGKASMPRLEMQAQVQTHQMTEQVVPYGPRDCWIRLLK